MAGIGMITSLLIASAVLLVGVSAEKHTVSFANKWVSHSLQYSTTLMRARI